VKLLLEELLAQPVDRVEFATGYAATWPNVKIGGQAVYAQWLDDVYARVNEPVAVAKVIWRDAPPTFIVFGTFAAPLTKTLGILPREATVTAVPGGATITVTANSVDYKVTFLASYTPAVNDTVRLLWQGSDCTVLGEVGATPPPQAPPPPPAPPPPAPTTGQLSCPAIDSATFSAGYGWNSYFGSNLYQGDGSAWGASSVNNGAWFYGGKNRDLAGKTVTRVQFRVPQRLNAGASGSPITMHLYTHAQDYRPGGDVTRTTGPWDLTVQPGQGAHWVDLDPGTIGVTLKAGGGIGISGSPYAGFLGIGSGKDPASGQLVIDWST